MSAGYQRRLKRIRVKKRYIVAMAVRMAARLGRNQSLVFAELYRRVRATVDERVHFTEHWLRVNMKRNGVGFTSRHKGELLEIGVDGWRMVHLEARSYSRMLAFYNYGDQKHFVSHHHPSGVAWEVRPDDKEQVCLGCGEAVPKQVLAWVHLRRMKEKLN